jgi:hypothetical protein
MLAARLAIDLSGDTVRAVTGAPGGRLWAAEAELPAGCVSHGTVTNPQEAARIIRQLVERAEFKDNRALVAANDALASFRVLSFPRDVSDSKIDVAVRSQLPTDGNRMGVHRYDLTPNGGDRLVFAVAFDRPRVSRVAEAVRLAGLEPAVVELKSLCLARVAPVPDCVVVDLGVEPAEAYLIIDSIPRAWHTFAAPSDGLEAASIAAGIRSVLGFHRRQTTGNGFVSDLPIYVTDKATAEQFGSEVSEFVGHPVAAMPQLARFAPEMKQGTYLACLGLLLRRR